MRRVYFIWFIRTVFHSLTVKLFVLALVFWQLLSYVSPVHIWQNARTVGTITGNYHFFLESFGQTETAVQVLGSMFLVLTLWLLKDIRGRVRSLVPSGLFFRSRF